MGDPFSVASSAIGVISLGLTVCDSLISYISAFKGQNQYLDNVSAKVGGLKKCLHFLSQALPPLRARTPDIARHIERSLSECSPPILILESKVASFQRVQGPSLVRDALRHATQKALFPFKREALIELSGTIDSLQQNLETVLAIANLKISAAQLDHQNVLTTTMDEVVNISSTISTNIQKTSHDISSLRTDFTTVQDELHTLNSTIDPGIQMILQQVDELSKQIALIQPSPATPVDILHRMDIRTQTLQQQLVSKLSLFQTFCIESQSSDVDTTAKPSSDEFSTPACNCRYRSPRYKLNKRRVFFDYSHLAEHDKHCLFYVEGMKQRNLRVKFSYCSQLISRSIRIVAAMTTKAGGKSMSAQIDWIPIVSRSTSPAMQLLLQLGDSIRDETRPPEALESVREDLLKLFAQGKAHPRETDQDGLTLLDHALQLAWYRDDQGTQFIQAYGHLLTSLIMLGSRAFLESIIYPAVNTPLRRYPQLHLLAKRLIGLGAFEPDSYLSAQYWWQDQLMFSPEWIDVFGSGPLSQAIVQRNPFQLSRLLQNERRSLLTVNDFGHSLLHLSASWPVGLVLLLKQGGASLVNQKDEAGRLPLSYAMTFMQQDERWRTFLGPSGSARRQDSLTAIKLLFAAGTAIANTELARNEFTGVIAGLLTTGSTSMADHLLGALTNRRQRLQRLGEIHLSFRHGDARRRTPYEVLDERAFQVVSALSEVGVEVPPALATLEKQCTIWHDSAATMSVDMAKMLWTAGFRDVEGLDEKGCTCLMTLNRSYWNDDIERILSFGDWLCEQGADLSATFLDAKYFVAIQLDIKDQGN